MQKNNSPSDLLLGLSVISRGDNEAIVEFF